MNITIKKLSATNTSEFVEMIRLFEDVFELKNFTIPDNYYLEGLLKKNDFIVYIAVYDNNVIGGLTAYTLPSCYFPSSEVYIYDLAVKRSFQRRGIGRQLLCAVSEFCQQNNYREFFVQADEIDSHALAFYGSTGGTPERVVHFYYPTIKENNT